MANVVLILGAGASCPFGYPTGRELRAELTDLRWLGRHEHAYWANCDDFSQVLPRRDRIQRHGQILEQLNMSLQPHSEMAQAFLESGCQSIDTFVSNRPEFAAAAKVSISIALLAKESWDSLFALETSGNWYEWLWNRIVGTATKPEQLDFDKYQIFTFNYDRSLEAYIFRALCARFNLNAADAVSYLSKLRVVHAYGRLSDIGAFCNESVPFGQGVTPQAKSVAAAAENLRLIPEHRDDDSHNFDVARRWFHDGSIICFLGYGFDQLNDQRLRLSSVLSMSSKTAKAAIFATTKGLRTGEVELARRRILSEHATWTALDLDCLEAVRSWAHVLDAN